MKKNIKTLLSAAVFTTVISAPVHSAEILFGIINGSYNSYGVELSGYLSSAGHNVDTFYLGTTAASGINYSSYDQVWVYDLSTGSDNTSTLTSNYSAIANWFDSASHDLIVDGRILSSSTYASSYSGGSYPAWIQNYASALDARSGGLVLGTDHNVFTSGINSVNSLINIDPFTGNFQQEPYQAIVDQASPLFSAGGTHDCVERGGITFEASSRCIWDHSSTSFVPTGQQTNTDIFLTPVAYHGAISSGNFDNAYAQAAVATTMGSITFGTCGGPNQDPCSSDIPVPSPLALLGLGLAAIGLTRKKKPS